MNLKQPGYFREAVFQIPIWFPEEGDRDPLVAEFWRVFPKEELGGKLDSTNRAVFNRAVDLHVWLGEKLLEISEFEILNHELPRGYSPIEWKSELGWCCLVFEFEFQIDSSVEDKPVRVEYCQPLLPKGDEAAFFYLPVLKSVPVMTDPVSYQMLILPEKGCRLEISNGDAHALVEEGCRAKLTPQHHVPIRAIVKTCATNGSSQ